MVWLSDWLTKQIPAQTACCCKCIFQIRRKYSRCISVSSSKAPVNDSSSHYMLVTPCSLCCLAPAPNTRWFCPCWLLSRWLSSTSWFKDDAHGCPRSPWPSDFWVFTATGQRLATSCFLGNMLVEMCPSKCFFFLTPWPWLSWPYHMAERSALLVSGFTALDALHCDAAERGVCCPVSAPGDRAWDPHHLSSDDELRDSTGALGLHTPKSSLTRGNHRLLKKSVKVLQLWNSSG